MIAALFEITPWFCLVYVGVMNVGYLALSVMAFVALGRYTSSHSLEVPEIYSDFEPPVTVIVPAYNEELTVVASVRSLLQLRYPQFEVVVVNDGSKDRTLAALIEAFDLRPFPEVMRVRLTTARVRRVYRSPAHPELRVIDKENGGKADALNTGINAARYPLFCALDADGILQPDSLRRLVRPFIEDSRTVAAGGIIRIANGCDVVRGWLVRASPPRNLLGALQVIEYCRAFLSGRLGWDPLNSVLVISGAFGVFHKETVVAAGGYRTDVAGEDMELVVRMHRLLRRAGTSYRITFIPDPVSWTEAPEDIRVLRRQRVRWQRGLCDSLFPNIDLMLSRSGGCVGWIAFPFALIFECLSPLIETIGYLVVVTGYLTGRLDPAFALGFLIVSIGLGVLLSMSSLLLDEISFHTYPKSRHLVALLAASVAENFGYRQLNAVWRLEGLVRWAVGARQVWGEMTRSARWNTNVTSADTSSLQRS